MLFYNNIGVSSRCNLRNVTKYAAESGPVTPNLMTGIPKLLKAE